jgi:hypothetical protein
MGDTIQQLPTDNLPPTSEEKDMIQWMFPNQEKKEEPSSSSEIPNQPVITSKFRFEMKSFFIIILIYILVSNSFTDSMIHKILPITTKSSIFLLALKSIIFAIILFIFLNLYYRKN